MIAISIGDKEYNVKEAKSKEEKERGLSKIEKLPSDGGMLFYFDPPLTVSMWMKDTFIPLDIIFINEDQEVISVHLGIPEDESPLIEKGVAYVLEVNAKSGIEEGDYLEFDEDSNDESGPVMMVLAPDGSALMELWGGERIFSRKNTVVLIRKAKKADLTKEDKDYKALGRYMFKCIHAQDNREPEYVLSPK